MSVTNEERLYNLLPALYRIRDDALGEPLRALLSVIEGEMQLVVDDMDELYDNWFVETCAEWVVPYIGDLLGVRGLLPIETGAFSQRALVANTLAYRRAKGTAAVLEQLARDVTGWPAKAVEFFELLATTQYLNHIRPDKGGTLSLRDANALELVGGPFERAAHTADVRHIDNARGEYNIPNVGLFLWRLQGYFVQRSAARAVSDPPDGRYTFNPLGLSVPLFNRPRSESELAQAAGEENVPGPLRRRPLYDELEARRQALVDGRTPRGVYWSNPPVLQVWFQKNDGDPFTPVPPDEILICNLSDLPTNDWRRPPQTKQYRRTSDGALVDRNIQVALDPVLGRLSFREAMNKVHVSYSYGFSGDIGGGPYNRQDSLAQWLNPLTTRVTFQVGVTQDRQTLDQASDPNQLAPSLPEAIQRWNDYVTTTTDRSPFGILTIMDDETYSAATAPTIQLPADATLAIVAADWMDFEPPDPPGTRQRVPGQIVPDNLRPHILGDLTVHGSAASSSANPGTLVLDGLLIEGALRIADGNLGSLRLAHCTLVPGKGGVSVTAQNTRLKIDLVRSICGPIGLPDSVPGLSLQDSIVDAGSGAALTAGGANVEVQTSTVFGGTSVSSLEASNSIFTELVKVTRRQTGCVRFSYLPFESLAPRRYHCQPLDAASAARVTPQFTSRAYGQPGYAQLAQNCPREILTGSEEEGEMGAFNLLQQAQRLKNLRTSLDEYLRFGLEAGVFFVT